MSYFQYVLYILSIGFYINSLLVKTRVKLTLYTLILYWSGARHWAIKDVQHSFSGGHRVNKFSR